MLARRLSIAVLRATVAVIATAAAQHAQADIFRWDNGQLVPGTSGVRLQAGVDLSGRNTHFRNLQYAAISGNLRNARFDSSWLQFASLAGADLNGASFTGADLTGAIVAGAEFQAPVGLTKEQIYSTASYQQQNLQGIWLHYFDLSGWDLRGFNLSDARFTYSILEGVDLSGANVTRASFDTVTNGGITKEQLYSTVNYQQKDLRGIGLYGNDLDGADFRGQDLTGANLGEARLAGADFTGAIIAQTAFARTTPNGFTKEQFYSTASYQLKDLQGTGLYYNDLSGWDFSGQNLKNASFNSSTLTGASFAGALVAYTVFERVIGFTSEQLYSTASYQQQDLRSFSLSHVDVSGWDFSGQNLTNADFDDAIYVGTNLTAADTRGGQFFEFSTALTRNTIAPDGTLSDLALAGGDRLVVRDYDGVNQSIPITVRGEATIGEGGTLQLAFESDEWNSTIAFESGIPVTLGGVLELTFSADTNVGSQVGRTFTAFNWNGVDPAGEFQIASPYVWDTSKLYTTGEVTLAAVPEPTGAILVLAAMPVAVVACRWLGRCSLRNRLATREHTRASLQG